MSRMTVSWRELENIIVEPDAVTTVRPYTSAPYRYTKRIKATTPLL